MMLQIIFSASNSLTPIQVKSILEANADQISIIGGSSLSPPELNVEHPYQIDLGKAVFGYSDVGFRLSFSKESRVGLWAII